MKRPMPWSEQVDLISSDELSSSTSSSSSDTEMGDDNASGGQQSNDNVTTDKPIKEVKPEDCDGLADADSCDALREQADLLLKRAEMYQDYMQQLPIPTKRGSVIPYTSWVGLGRSIKQLYDQPLHYLTNIHLKQWDQLRFGMVNDHRDLDTIMHPLKAEATIWLIEEIHRHTSSHHQIAKLWSLDPMHDAFIDSIVPQSPSQ